MKKTGIVNQYISMIPEIFAVIALNATKKHSRRLIVYKIESDEPI